MSAKHLRTEGVFAQTKCGSSNRVMRKSDMDQHHREARNSDPSNYNRMAALASQNPGSQFCSVKWEKSLRSCEGGRRLVLYWQSDRSSAVTAVVSGRVSFRAWVGHDEPDMKLFSSAWESWERTLLWCVPVQKKRLIAIFVIWLSPALCVSAGRLQLTMNSNQQTHFLTVHGRRAWAGGYANAGLEIWAGALQIADDVHAEFRRSSDVTSISGEQIVSAISVAPSHFSRTYVGPDFSVEEQVWVPLEQPAVLIRYRVRSVHSVQVIVRFHPSLNLMWPAAVGGQEARWDNALSGYVLTEPSKTFAAALLSPGASAHDEPVNSTRTFEQSDELTVALDEKSPQVLFARLKTAEQDGSELELESAQALLTSEQWKQDSEKHYEGVSGSAVQIDTPDEDLNRALEWAELALDQAWICTDKLGCAYAGGFGPSRRSRRPQYAWYFAGDGMISTHAALAAGDYEHARDEIRFIAKYQDSTSGMIWHELSQSAPYLDWRGKYPYLFVHADVSYSYIPAVAEYVRTTNDRAFLREIWPSVEKAFTYCRNLIDANGLPEIPAGKLGMDEQNPMRDELGLSADWILACQEYATLAALIGDGNAAQQAQGLAQKAKASFANRYWDPQRNFAIQGHLRNGEPMEGRGLGPISAVEHHLFNDAQSEQLLAEVASRRFQSDWGTRSVAEDDPGYDPAGYAHGSVWALGTADVAQAFWAMHRPEVAWQIWRRLIPWSTLDSPGHMDEVLAGDTYHPQTESVPEQTWSSASFLTAAVRGLFGIDVEAEHAQLTLTPHLPDEWERADFRNVRVANSTLSLSFQQSIQALTLRLENRGAHVHVRFHPRIPLGSKILGATLGGRDIAVKLERNEQDEHASMEFDAGNGTTDVTLRFRGGVTIAVPFGAPPIGDPSTGLKLVSESLSGNHLRVAADAMGGEKNGFRIRTAREISSIEGARVERIAGDQYTVLLDPPSDNRGYERRTIVISF